MNSVSFLSHTPHISVNNIATKPTTPNTVSSQTAERVIEEDKSNSNKSASIAMDYSSQAEVVRESSTSGHSRAVSQYLQTQHFDQRDSISASFGIDTFA